MKVFHIRQPGPLRRKTYCGAPPTQHDNLASWQAFAVGNYEPCAECVAARKRCQAAQRKPNPPIIPLM
jgi:hypothetical protein